MSFEKDVLVCALLYGDHEDLHRRIVESFKKCIPRGVMLYIWGNLLGPKSRALVESLQTDRCCIATFDDKNTPKYLVMREMFSLLKQPVSNQHKWLVWFDDDSWITSEAWLVAMEAYISSKRHENICYIGQPWFVHHLPGQWEFISQAKWFKGKPPEMIKERPGVTFAQGAYWWLRTDILCQLDWPDERLKHNGGDTLLGEAIRQQSLPFHKKDYGVKVNDAKRRGFSEKPAGSTTDTRR